MSSALIIAPSLAEKRRRSLGADGADPSWFGELFETALVEVVRMLDGPGKIATVLVPWRRDTAALLAAAAADTAAAFDPEGPRDALRQRSRLVPYLESDGGGDMEADPFWRASHLSLRREAPMALKQAAAEYRPSHIIALGVPSDPQLTRQIVHSTNAQLFVFPSLVSPEWISKALDVPLGRVTDLEAGWEKLDEEAILAGKGMEFERRAEVGLEPFLPFGLLLQLAWDEILSDERHGIE